MSRTLKDLLSKNPSVSSHECICSQFSKDERGMAQRRSQALVDDSATAAMIVAHDDNRGFVPAQLPFGQFLKIQ